MKLFRIFSCWKLAKINQILFGICFSLFSDRVGSLIPTKSELSQWVRSLPQNIGHQSLFELSCRRTARLKLRGGFDTIGFDDGFRQGSPSRMAVKRIQAELSALEQDPSPFFRAHPLENDILDWHFVMLGANHTAYQGRLCHMDHL